MQQMIKGLECLPPLLEGLKYDMSFSVKLWPVKE